MKDSSPTPPASGWNAAKPDERAFEMARDALLQINNLWVLAEFAGEDASEQQVLHIANVLRNYAALTRPDSPGWQPINSAPKDGTWLLAYSPSGNWRRISWGKNHFGDPCWCTADYWWSDERCEFTHWLPLPEPPSPREGE